MTEDGEQTFLAVDDVLRPGESFAREQRALGAHASGPGIDGVFHVGELAGRDRARAERARRADADRRHHLLQCEIQYAARRDRRGERAQRGVMPAVFAHAGPPDFAQPHFDFVGDDRGENQILAAQTFAFTERQRRRR